MVQLSWAESELIHPLQFCSIQFLQELDDIHPHWGGQSTLLSPPTQMLISFRNTATDTSGNNIEPTLWASCGSDKVAHKINHHTSYAALYMLAIPTCLISLAFCYNLELSWHLPETGLSLHILLSLLGMHLPSRFAH